MYHPLAFELEEAGKCRLLRCCWEYSLFNGLRCVKKRVLFLSFFCFVASSAAAVIAKSPSATYRMTDASIALVVTSVSGLAKAGPVNGARAPELTHLKHQPLHEGKST